MFLPDFSFPALGCAVNAFIQHAIFKKTKHCKKKSKLLLFFFMYFPPNCYFSVSLGPSQDSNDIRWSLICMHLQNIACAVFAVKGIEKRVLVSVYVLPH